MQFGNLSYICYVGGADYIKKMRLKAQTRANPTGMGVPDVDNFVDNFILFCLDIKRNSVIFV